MEPKKPVELILAQSTINKTLKHYSVFEMKNGILYGQVTAFGGGEVKQEKGLTSLSRSISNLVKDKYKNSILFIKTLPTSVIEYDRPFNTLNPSAFRAVHKRLKVLEPLSQKDMDLVYKSLNTLLEDN